MIIVQKITAAGLSLGFVLAAIPASATPVITAVGANLTTSPFSFSYLGDTFTFSNGAGFPNFFSVSTANGAAVRTVFGSPSTDFTNRSTVTYDQSILGGYASFSLPTIVSYTNGDNFLGLSVTSANQTYYGFAYTTNAVLNSFGFETAPNTGIVATTAIPAAVPESATWAMMILGMGAVGFAMRRRQKVTTRVSYAA